MQKDLLVQFYDFSHQEALEFEQLNSKDDDSLSVKQKKDKLSYLKRISSIESPSENEISEFLQLGISFESLPYLTPSSSILLEQFEKKSNQLFSNLINLPNFVAVIHYSGKLPQKLKEIINYPQTEFNKENKTIFIGLLNQHSYNNLRDFIVINKLDVNLYLVEYQNFLSSIFNLK